MIWRRMLVEDEYMQENVNDSLSGQTNTQSEQNIVLCMKWGTKYGAEYVNRLYNMVKRHTTVDFKMVCLTDRTEGIDPAVECFPIPPLALPAGSPERGWNKLSTFEPDLYGLKGNALFLDLDVVMIIIDGAFSGIVQNWLMNMAGYDLYKQAPALVDNVLRMFMPDENITKLIHQTNELSVM